MPTAYRLIHPVAGLSEFAIEEGAEFNVLPIHRVRGFDGWVSVLMDPNMESKRTKWRRQLLMAAVLRRMMHASSSAVAPGRPDF